MLGDRSLLILPAVLLFAVFPALADEVVLENGDRLTGTVLSKTPDGLLLQTAYAGRLRIDWRVVRRIKTDKPVHVLARDGTSQIFTRLEPSDTEAAVKLADWPDEPPMPLERIAYVNPTPSQSGEGMEFRGRVNVAASSNSGNSTTNQVIAEGEVGGVAKSSRFTARLRGEQRTNSAGLTASNWLAKADHDWFVAPRRFIYGRSSAERDPFRDIASRFAIGSGYGLQLIDSDQTKLSVKGGLDYVWENRIDADSQNFPALGWGINVRHWLIGRWAEVFHEQDGFLNLTDKRDITLRTRTGLRLPIVERLSAQVQALVDWDGRPEKRESLDVSVQLGLGYEW